MLGSLYKPIHLYLIVGGGGEGFERRGGGNCLKGEGLFEKRGGGGGFEVKTPFMRTALLSVSVTTC